MESHSTKPSAEGDNIKTVFSEHIKPNISIIAAILANIGVGVVKFIAAAISGSSAMFSEGIHSIVDSANDVLVLFGVYAAKRKPDLEHPFGYGKSLYFYTFVVALLIFLIGGCFTIFNGYRAWVANDMSVLGDPTLNYIVIFIALILEGTSLVIAIRTVNRERGDKSIFQYVRDCKDPSNFTVLLEDSAAEAGLLIAFFGIFFGHMFHNPRIDAAASILIGVLLIIVAVILVRETKGLLIGEGLEKEELEEVVFIVEEDPAVLKCGRVLTMYIGPDEMLMTLDVTFDDDETEDTILRSIDRIESSLVKRFPQANRIFIEVESLNNVYRQRQERRRAIEEAEAED